MPYCIYLRKSRSDMEAESHGEGETLARHEHALLELSKRQKLAITSIYREVVSGETISSRPVMQQLLNEVEQGIWTGVLVMEVERLARGDTIDQGIVSQAFKYSSTKIITPMKTYDPNNEYDEEYFEFGLFMSRREYKTINRRLQRGRIQSVKEGKYLGTTPPYGYIRKKLEKEKGYTLEIVEDESKVVQLIFELYTKTEDRIGVSRIVRKLNELKIPPQKGTVWVPGSIQCILKNPVYIGKIRWNARPTVKSIVNGEMTKHRPRAKEEDWILVDGLHESIIDIDTWNLTQENISKNRAPSTPREIKSPLAGLVICGVCGRRMVRRPYNDRSQPDTLMCPVTSCDNVSSPLHLVENEMLKALEIWLEDYEINEVTNISDNDELLAEQKVKTIKRIDDELKNLDTQIDNIHNLLEQGVYSTDVFLQRSKALSERIKENEESKIILLDDIKKDNRKLMSKTEFVPKIKNVLDAYSRAENAAYKNALLKEVIDKIIYVKTVNGRWHSNPNDFELTISPKVPK